MEIRRAALYVNRRRNDKQYKRTLYYGMTAYVIAAGLVGWWIGTGGL
jgi:heme A synthase